MEENREENETQTQASGEETGEGEGFLVTAARAVGSTLGKVAAAISSDEPEAATVAPKRRRQEKIGLVTSDKMTKTVVVRVERQVKHPKYKRYIRKRSKFMAHDEIGAHIGDTVKIIETRPLSARKRWRVIEIIQKAS
jgi:small subunit ribosomal protein S17